MYSTRASIRLQLRPGLARGTVQSRHASSFSPSTTSRPSDKEVQAARAYCENLLQKYDSPSYTLQTFIPRSAYTAYLCIRAFNLSLSTVADSVSNPTVGALRMQFWRDTISRAFDGAPPKEPVAILLSHVLERLAERGGRPLNKSWFMRVINTREKYLTNPPFVDVDALESYAESTYSTLLYLTLSALPLHSLTADHVASHVGKATGIATVLRGVPLLAFPPPPNHHSNTSGLPDFRGPGGSGRQGVVTLPLDIMASAGVRDEDILRQGPEAPRLRDAVFAVATRANDHLITAREMLQNVRAGRDAGHDYEHRHEQGHEDAQGTLDDSVLDHTDAPSSPSSSQSIAQLDEVNRAFGVLMPAVATSMWLDKLQEVDFDVFRPELRRRDWKLPWKAYMAYKRHMF
ncbi:MAG: hypothetical protein M1838_000131 [Thelocarpon superellum]|nr:MAG: hypothetical protein M1838_000131 [Thelocarpon superellum]